MGGAASCARLLSASTAGVFDGGLIDLNLRALKTSMCQPDCDGRTLVTRREEIQTLLDQAPPALAVRCMLSVL